jgi:hypothetical protein
MFVTNNEKKIGRQYQTRRKNMRTSGLLYFSSNDRFKKEPINFNHSNFSSKSVDKLYPLIFFSPILGVFGYFLGHHKI